MKEQLVFDTTNANTILESDSVGAFVRSADGTLITHTTVGAIEALDVRIAEGINVEVDLDAADDSVQAWAFDGTGNAIGSTGGALHISDAGGSLTVDAVDLDIRDLSSLTDSVEVLQATHDNLNANANLQVGDVDVDNANPVPVSDAGGSLTVDAVDLDIRDLSAATDSVQAWAHDGAGTALTSTLVGADQALDVNVANAITVEDVALANVSAVATANTLAVAGTSEDVVASPLTDRKYLFIDNFSNRRVFIGGAGVTEANGYPLSPRASIMLRAGTAVDIEFVGPTGETPEIRTLELS